MSRKLKLAVIYGAICGGCDVALVNIGETLADLLARYDIVYWGAVVDGKSRDLEEARDLDVAIYMGSIRTENNLKYARLARSKAKLVVAYGTCSVYGGIPGLGYLLSTRDIADIVNGTITTNIIDQGNAPGYIALPRLLEEPYKPIETLDPDILVPGCPPSNASNRELVKILVNYAKGWKPHGKILLGEDESLCSKCPRKPEDTSKIVMPGIKRLYDVRIDDKKCFLEQGILCMGPATRAACKRPCIENNMPCIGCMGPAPGVDDIGLRYGSSLTSILLVDKEKELLEEGLARELDNIVDPVGVFYKYTLPSSILIDLRRRLGGKDYA